MPACYILPGFGGSSLRIESSATKLWVDEWGLFRYGLAPLRLAADGFTASSPNGREMKPFGIVNNYLGSLYDVVERRTNHKPIELPWDWRKDMRIEGSRLAVRILLDVDGPGPHTIVAHSAGGIVARWIWANLKAQNAHTKIRRIITLGTPHRGTLQPALFFSGLEPLGDALARVPGYGNERVVYRGDPRYLPVKVHEIAATFPGLYQLMPLLDSHQQATNPLAAGLLGVEGWPIGHEIDLNRLAEVRDTYQPQLMAASAMPGYEVLTTVAGTGYHTPNTVKLMPFTGYGPWFAETLKGDRLVTEESAIVQASRRYIVSSDHTGLVTSTAVLRDLPEWINEVRTPNPSPPATVNKTGPAAAPSVASISVVVPLNAAVRGQTASDQRSSTQRSDATPLNATIPQTDPPKPGTPIVPKTEGSNQGEIDIPEPNFRRSPATSGRRR